MEMLKFGRRVVFDKQLSNKEMLETHISQIHDHSKTTKALYESAKKEEREHVDQRKREDDLREAEKQLFNQ